MRAISNELKRHYDGSFVLETIIGRINVEYNRHGWYISDTRLKYFLKKDYYPSKQEIIKEIDIECNEKLNSFRHLILND